MQQALFRVEKNQQSVEFLARALAPVSEGQARAQIVRRCAVEHAPGDVGGDGFNERR